MKLPAEWHTHVRGDLFGGAISAAVAIPLAMGYGMFAFVALGENYFASGALAGLYTAFAVAIVCVVLGDNTTTIYAPRITSTFFLGLLILGLVHSESPAIRDGGIPLTLAIIRSLLFRLRHGIFAVPIDNVREIVSVPVEQIPWMSQHPVQLDEGQT